MMRISKTSSIIPIEIVHTRPKNDRQQQSKKLQIDVNENIPIEIVNTNHQSRVNPVVDVKNSVMNQSPLNISNSSRLISPSKPKEATNVPLKEEVPVKLSSSKSNERQKSSNGEKISHKSSKLDKSTSSPHSKPEKNERTIPVSYQNNSKPTPLSTAVSSSAEKKKSLEITEETLNEDEEVCKITNNVSNKQRPTYQSPEQQQADVQTSKPTVQIRQSPPKESKSPVSAPTATPVKSVKVNVDVQVENRRPSKELEKIPEESHVDLGTPIQNEVNRNPFKLIFLFTSTELQLFGKIKVLNY